MTISFATIALLLLVVALGTSSADTGAADHPVLRHRQLVLPPGFEDEMWCPPGYCDQSITLEPGFAGPASAFHTCYNEENGTTVDEVWTGTLTNVTAPEGWITAPELEECQESDDPIEPQCDGGCDINGQCFEDGEQYYDPHCLPNTCSCNAENPEVSACTMMACERDCDTGAVCEHDGNLFCSGDQFYDTACMPNTCRCSSNGGVACTKIACIPECTTDGDCEARVRSQSAQPEVYPLCECYALSLDPFIQGKFDECIGETDDKPCAQAKCSNTCAGKMPVCSANNTCVLEQCSDCEYDGVMYCAGDSFNATDGCNTCSCSDNGAVACTLMACLPLSDECSDCEYEGTMYCTGDSFDDADGCNSCSCSEGGAVACTEMACPPADECSDCEYAGMIYCAGDSFNATDGCNTCSCSEDGTVACTELPCPLLPDVEPMSDTSSGAVVSSLSLTFLLVVAGMASMWFNMI